MRHIILRSGKDSLACELVQLSVQPELQYEFLYCDTGAELPETYEWLCRVESVTGRKTTIIGEDLTARIHSYNGFLPSGRARYCTRESKIKPMESYLKGDDCTVYYGLRADENRTGYVPVASSRITPKYPLIESGVGLPGVYAMLDKFDLAPPTFFWPRLYDAVKSKMAVLSWDWESELTRTERIVLFAGRTRANCYFCFFQRQYEYIWLMETHPVLWEKAKAFENVGSEYTWRDGYSLAELEEPSRSEKIFTSRVNWVCGQIAKKMQLNLFDEDSDNEITGYSCGLMCGK